MNTRVHHRLSFSAQELDTLATEFSDYAAFDIADILRHSLRLDDQDVRIALIACEVAHAIHCTVQTLASLEAPPAVIYGSPVLRPANTFTTLKQPSGNGQPVTALRNAPAARALHCGPQAGVCAGSTAGRPQETARRPAVAAARRLEPAHKPDHKHKQQQQPQRVNAAGDR